MCDGQPAAYRTSGLPNKAFTASGWFAIEATSERPTRSCITARARQLAGAGNLSHFDVTRNVSATATSGGCRKYMVILPGGVVSRTRNVIVKPLQASVVRVPPRPIL
jgi:hypothetical protein